MTSKVARANYSDRRVFRDNLILYRVVSSLGTVKIGPSDSYGPLTGAAVFQPAVESIIRVLNENYHLWKRFYVEDGLERYFSFVTERVDEIGPMAVSRWKL